MCIRSTGLIFQGCPLLKRNSGGCCRHTHYAQFAATAGKLNFCNSGRFTDITPQSQRTSALLSAHFELAPSVDLFTESCSRIDTCGISRVRRYMRNSSLCQAHTPTIPMDEDVNVSFCLPRRRDDWKYSPRP